MCNYNRSEPFRSISEVAPDNLQTVLGQLSETNSWGLNRFSDPEYLPQRIWVEQKLREEFIVKGGKPELKYPIYFFLGRNSRFEEHPSNIGYSIKLEDLPSEVVGFTAKAFNGGFLPILKVSPAGPGPIRDENYNQVLRYRLSGSPMTLIKISYKPNTSYATENQGQTHESLPSSELSFIVEHFRQIRS